MSNKTAMQELIHWLKIGWKDEDIDTIIKKADMLIEKEKEQIKDAWINGDEDGFTWGEDNKILSEQYYNETYKQQDNGKNNN